MATYPDTVERWRPLVAKYFKPEDVDKALYVISGESGGNPGAVGDGGDSGGLFQLNAGGLGAGMTNDQKFDPETNIRVAAQAVYGGSGWRPWGEGTEIYDYPYDPATGKGYFGALGHNPYPGGSSRNIDGDIPSFLGPDVVSQIEGERTSLADGGVVSRDPGTLRASLDTARDALDTKRVAWDSAKATSTDPLKVGDGGIVMAWQSATVDPALMARLNEEADPIKRAALAEALGVDENGGKWIPLSPDDPRSKAYAEFSTAQDAYDRALADFKFSEQYDKQKTTAESYLNSAEGQKSTEITRQFRDFEDRASLFSDLLAAEQDFNFNADKQNVARASAEADGTVAPGFFGYAASITGPSMLSSILRPSLPDYVRPDYRLNTSVGLPGPQGFDDENFTPDGLPKFAEGTSPDIRDYRIPPDIAEMIGTPIDVPVGRLNLPVKPWPWGAQPQGVMR